MHQILVYSDSLSWGIVPETRLRLPFDQRWPGVLENQLNSSQRHRVRVIEDCLNGRRTVWDDPFKPGRNGLHGLGQRIELNSPLSAVILMLGTNDFQFCHPHNDAWSAAEGNAALIRAIRSSPLEPGMPMPEIVLVSPPQIRSPRGSIAHKFRDAESRCAGLADAYRRIASSHGCHFFDVEAVTRASRVDGVHLDAEQHLALGHALAQVMQEILDQSTRS
jgi:lysophospholipase L1-like esterase